MDGTTKARTKEAKAPDFELGGVTIPAGTRTVVDLPVSLLSNGVAADLRVMVVHGKRPGPTMFVSAAIHGDEIIGVEIIRRLSARPSLKNLQGTLLLIPIVNGYGFLNQSRYLPDRRDLNRSFPGSPKGSLAGRLAHVFLNEVVKRTDFGVDMHSAAIHRDNFPQLRISEGDETAMELANVFGAPVILKSKSRPGSLRLSAQTEGVPVLVYEGGEALRFDETAVRVGLGGVLRVMRHRGMIRGKSIGATSANPFLGRSSRWVRAQSGGLVRLFKKLGEAVEAEERIGVISDPFDEVECDLLAPLAGIIIGRTNQPIVNEGDALVHIAHSGDAEAVAEHVERMVDQLDNESLFYEDEIL